MDKTEIINLTEASGVSDNDYVMIDSPTQGVRKYLAKNFSSGSSGGMTKTLIYGNDPAIWTINDITWFDPLPILHLTDSLSGYDEIWAKIFTYDGDGKLRVFPFLKFDVKDILASVGGDNSIIRIPFYGFINYNSEIAWVQYYYDSANNSLLPFNSSGKGRCDYLGIASIYGVKY